MIFSFSMEIPFPVDRVLSRLEPGRKGGGRQHNKGGWPPCSRPELRLLGRRLSPWRSVAH